MARTAIGVTPSELQNSTHVYAADNAEASDSYEILPSPEITTYVEGQTFIFKANTANVGSSSLNISWLGPKIIKKHGNTNLDDNDIKAGSIVTVTYDGTYFQMTSMVANAVTTLPPRVGSTTSSATPTINTDNVDVYRLTAQAEDITSFTTNLSGTPTHGQRLFIEITGTAARAITWGASFEDSTVTLPTTTVSTDMLTVGLIFNSVTSKWRCVGYV